MLLKIREKSQGVFAWIILLLICVPFALWGIQNYIGGASEATIASVGDKEFFQQDLNRAYAQYSQNLQGINFDENEVKKQALDKLIKDEVLLQYAENEGLVTTDETARAFIKSLEYFQTDGQFDNKKYKAMLATQRMSPAEFVNRIRKALVMEQFQRSVIESSFVTQNDVESFFKIQNQQRNVELISIALGKPDKQPDEQEIEAYYQQNPDLFLTEEQISLEYVELSLDRLAKKVESTPEQLQAYYEEQKDLYTTKERRKISHILFAFTKDASADDKQLQRAINAKQALAEKDFSVLAAEVSDDKLTASKGGDLGLFNIGVMEKAFEDAASALKLGEVSEPVKSAFGYHLIKVTELVPGEIKSFDSVKEELNVAFQRAEAESTFYELGEILTEVSYENPDSLQAVADAVGVDINTTELFANKIEPVDEADTRVTSQAAVINAAFSEDVLKGNNSEPIELGSERLLVIRMLEHQPAQARELTQVKPQIITKLLDDKARQLAAEKAEKIKVAVLAGKSMQALADENSLEVQVYSELGRANGDMAWQVNQAVFKAAKPVDGKTTVVTVADPSGTQTVINLLAVTEGIMTESDKAKQKLAETNLAKALGQAEFNATVNSLQESAEVRINNR